MAEIETLEELPLSLPEAKEILENIQKRNKELNPKSVKVLDYISKVSSIKLKDYNELKKKLKELGIERLKERHIAKIIDIAPKDLESLKTIFVGENLSLKQEDLKKVLECIK